MSYHPRIESTELSSFITSRSRNSELWFVNNPELEEAVLSYAAKFSARYGVKIYALAIEGNHNQGPMLFPKGNRAHFMRDFNSCVAKAVAKHTPEYPGGRFWGRRYSAEILPRSEDIEEYFFYTVLQPVKDGLVEKISDYPGYNCFHDAVWGVKKKYNCVDWTAYHDKKRFNNDVRVSDFTEIIEFQYARLPGYEDLSQKEYALEMQKKLEERRVKIVQERKDQGLTFKGRTKLLDTKRGSLPGKTKTSTINTHRPRVLSTCHETRAKYKKWYFTIYFEYKEASKEYLTGNSETIFPEGTYKPYLNFHAGGLHETS